MTTLLTDNQYKQTLTPKMVNVTETAEPTVDIWEYVGQLVKQNVVIQYVYDKQLVETVYRNQTNTFDHVLLPTDKENYFVVLIVDLIHHKITGHYPLDLNKEYGLT
jgi:hypothetical protein